ncbi:hypothetical protein LAZ67_23001581 [Cordylochernes scorpioides]|uniref:RNA-directed DNA polymerase n=1 Tax=Cordylochernes scorpioides TaxID=51811 RepID=A0ABY6LTW6_9ARAC|nr:hypothetical protein LAZ67_23001581 [Cordylochernes scorpioides]
MRQDFAAWVFRQIDIDENWLSNVLWTDDAHFSLNGEFNTQNSRIWATENPRIFTEIPLHQPRVTVLVKALSEITFMKDGGPPHTSRGHQRNTGGDAVSNPRRSRRTQGLPPIRSFSASPTRRIKVDPEDAASWNNNVFFCQPPPPSLEFFGGYSEEDPAEWLEELELLARQQRWPEDVMLAYARSYLKGPAKKWAKLNTPQIFSNWTTFKKTLMRDFRIADTTKFKLIMELQNRVQGYNESTLRYAEDVLNLCNKGKRQKLIKSKGLQRSGDRINLIVNLQENKTIRIVICGMPIEGLIDTGAMVSCIDEDLVKKLELKIIPDKNLKLKSAGDQKLNAIGNNTLWVESPNVFDQNEPNLRYAHIAEDKIIPEFCLCLVKGYSKTSITGREILIENIPSMTTKYNLITTRSLLSNTKKNLNIWILNGTNKPVKLFRNTKIGILSEVDRLYQTENQRVASIRTDFDINPELCPEERSQVLTLLGGYGEMFTAPDEYKGRTHLVKHQIRTTSDIPIRKNPCRVSLKERKIIGDQINNDCFDSLHGARYFTSLDLCSGYWQVEVEEQDREKTAFITPDGLYQFNVLPFGLCNGPATFERLMDTVLRTHKWKICLCYLDDVIIFSEDLHSHLNRLKTILECLKTAGLTLNISKCRFAYTKLLILGHVVSNEGIAPDPEKNISIRKFPTPRTVKDVRAFLGLCSYYRRFIREFSKVALPLQILTRKNYSFAWGKEQELSFNSLKNKLISPEVLIHYDPNKPIGLHTDASDQGLGAVLVHLDENTKERPISYASRTLQKAETNYSTTEKECLAIIWAIKKFRPYIYGRKFTIYTDHHSLCWMAKMKTPAGRLARWSLELQEYDFAIKYKSGKTHLDADGLSRCPIPDKIISTINYEEHDYDSYIKKIDNLVNQNPNSYGENFTKFKEKLFKKNPSVTGDPWLLIVPKNKQKELLENMHDHPTSGHMGIKRTYNRLKSKYFWPSMLKTVEEYVSSCPECQFRKTPSQLPQGLLQPIPPASRPFEKMGIDLMGRFPKSGRGNSWILVCTDYYSRYIETAALPRGTAEEIADFFLQRVVLRHGAPKTVISDRGSCFLSKLFNEVLKINNRRCEVISTSRTIARQNKSKQLYDGAHREFKYAINDLVLIWTPIRKVGRADKLQRRYVGPYQILRQTSPVNYEVIEIAEGKRKKRQIVHVPRMKPYRSPDLRTSLFQEGE